MFVVPTKITDTRPFPNENQPGLPYWSLLRQEYTFIRNYLLDIAPVAWEVSDNAFDSSTVGMIEFRSQLVEIFAIRREDGVVTSVNLPLVPAIYRQLVPRRSKRVRTIH